MTDMENKYLNFSGLQKFKIKFEESMKDYVRDTVGLKDGQTRLTFADNDDVLNIKSGVDLSNNDDIITVKTLAEYHKSLTDSVIVDTVSTALDDKESDLYSKVDGMIDEKMKWNGEFPESN